MIPACSSSFDHRHPYDDRWHIWSNGIGMNAMLMMQVARALHIALTASPRCVMTCSIMTGYSKALQPEVASWRSPVVFELPAFA